MRLLGGQPSQKPESTAVVATAPQPAASDPAASHPAASESTQSKHTAVESMAPESTSSTAVQSTASETKVVASTSLDSTTVGSTPLDSSTASDSKLSASAVHESVATESTAPETMVRASVLSNSTAAPGLSLSEPTTSVQVSTISGQMLSSQSMAVTSSVSSSTITTARPIVSSDTISTKSPEIMSIVSPNTPNDVVSRESTVLSVNPENSSETCPTDGPMPESNQTGDSNSTEGQAEKNDSDHTQRSESSSPKPLPEHLPEKPLHESMPVTEKPPPEPMHVTEKPPPGHMPVTENPQPEPMPVTEIVSREPEIGPHYDRVWDLEDAKLERITSSTFMSRYRRRSDSSLAMKEPADPSEGRPVADLDVLRAKARATEEVIGVRECGPSDLQRMSFHMNLSASEKEEKASMPEMNSVWDSYREAHVRCRICKQVGCDHMTAAPARVLTETWADQNKAAAMVSAGEISDDEDYLEPSFVRRQQRSRIRREVRAQARSTVARPKTKTTQRSRRQADRLAPRKRREVPNRCRSKPSSVPQEDEPLIAMEKAAAVTRSERSTHVSIPSIASDVGEFDCEAGYPKEDQTRAYLSIMKKQKLQSDKSPVPAPTYVGKQSVPVRWKRILIRFIYYGDGLFRLIKNTFSKKKKKKKIKKKNFYIYKKKKTKIF
eukprot:986744_1